MEGIMEENMPHEHFEGVSLASGVLRFLDRLGASGGIVSEKDAVRALDSVHSAKSPQWSVVCNPDARSASIRMEGRCGKIYPCASGVGPLIVRSHA